MISARVYFAWTAAGAAMAMLSVTAVYLIEIRATYARVSTGSEVVRTPFGNLEYAEVGDGLPVLVVHGPVAVSIKGHI